MIGSSGPCHGLRRPGPQAPPHGGVWSIFRKSSIRRFSKKRRESKIVDFRHDENRLVKVDFHLPDDFRPTRVPDRRQVARNRLAAPSCVTTSRYVRRRLVQALRVSHRACTRLVVAHDELRCGEATVATPPREAEACRCTPSYENSSSGNFRVHLRDLVLREIDYGRKGIHCEGESLRRRFLHRCKNDFAKSIAKRST